MATTDLYYVLQYEKSTKNTHRYTEVDAEGQPVENPVVGNQYIQKSQIGEDPPGRLYGLVSTAPIEFESE